MKDLSKIVHSSLQDCAVKYEITIESLNFPECTQTKPYRHDVWEENQWRGKKYAFSYFMKCPHTKILLNQLLCKEMSDLFCWILIFLLTVDQGASKLPLTSARSNASAHSALSFGGDDPSTWSDNDDSLFSSARGAPKKVNLAKFAGVNNY